MVFFERFFSFFLGTLILSVFSFSSESRVEAQGVPAVEPSPQVAPRGSASPVPGQRRLREKEAEGSKAPNRFQTDTVLKSKYTLDGQPLEVDPD